MPSHLSFDVFAKTVRDARDGAPDATLVAPVFRRVSADLLTPVSAYLSLRADGPHSFLLESVEGGEKLARYSFLGGSPFQLLEARGRDVLIRKNDETIRIDDASLFDVLRDEMERFTPVHFAELPRFTGGAVGYVGYDAVRLIEHLPDAPPDELNVPDAVWAFYDTIAGFDHVRKQLLLMANAFIEPGDNLKNTYQEAQKRLDDLTDLITQTPSPPDAVRLEKDEPLSNMTRDEFESSVTTAKDHIFEGDIFQVVLSQRFSMPFSGDPFNLYRTLRQVNPSPYLFYLNMESFALAGSSPEVLVRVDDNTAEVLPIAGTRPRGNTAEEDQELAEELSADPKERAEHLMLVDLGRNDLGRVCNFGTIKVDRYAYIERYSHVMHIVSSVSGKLKDNSGAMDALAACFPAGTVSGAPKVRAMEIIDELEPSRRSVYAGAVGYIDFSGSMDTCITIRTMLLKDNIAHIQAGAGIVADSSPSLEYEETKNKAQALFEAMNMASEELL